MASPNPTLIRRRSPSDTNPLEQRYLIDLPPSATGSQYELTARLRELTPPASLAEPTLLKPPPSRASSVRSTREKSPLRLPTPTQPTLENSPRASSIGPAFNNSDLDHDDSMNDNDNTINNIPKDKVIETHDSDNSDGNITIDDDRSGDFIRGPDSPNYASDSDDARAAKAKSKKRVKKEAKKMTQTPSRSPTPAILLDDGTLPAPAVFPQPALNSDPVTAAPTTSSQFAQSHEAFPNHIISTTTWSIIIGLFSLVIIYLIYSIFSH